MTNNQTFNMDLLFGSISIMEGTNSTTTNVNSSNTYVSHRSRTWLAIVPLIILLISSVTAIGNLMVIVAYIRDHRIRFKVANLFILNLAITDFIVGVFMWPVNVSWLIKNYWSHGEVICKVWLTVDYTITMMSALTLMMISWDRYCSLSMGMRYQAFQTKKRAGLILFMTWTSVFLWYSFLAFGWSPITGQYSVDYDVDCELEFTAHLVMTLVVNVLEFFIPATILLTLNIAVYMNIKRRSRGIVGPIPSPPNKPLSKSTPTCPEGTAELQRPGTSRPSGEPAINLQRRVVDSSNASNEAVNKPEEIRSEENAPKHTKACKGRIFARHRKSAVVLGILVGCFLVCWVPIQITSVMFAICGTNCVTYLNWDITNALVWGNSMINPFIYAATNKHFRRNFRYFLLLHRWACDRKCC